MLLPDLVPLELGKYSECGARLVPESIISLPHGGLMSKGHQGLPVEASDKQIGTLQP